MTDCGLKRIHRLHRFTPILTGCTSRGQPINRTRIQVSRWNLWTRGGCRLTLTAGSTARLKPRPTYAVSAHPWPAAAALETLRLPLPTSPTGPSPADDARRD